MHNCGHHNHEDIAQHWAVNHHQSHQTHIQHVAQVAYQHSHDNVSHFESIDWVVYLNIKNIEKLNSELGSSYLEIMRKLGKTVSKWSK